MKTWHMEMTRLLLIRPLPPEADVLASYERFREFMGWPYPADATPIEAAWGAFHKARLHWTQSTRQDRRDSRKWLLDHGYKLSTSLLGDPPTEH